MNFGDFEFREPAPALFANRQKVSLFRWLTRKVPPLFLCGGDVLTIGPMVTGRHEPEVLQVLAFLAGAGFDQALVDVGANIGLITWHCRDLFRAFHCFEPNPKMFHVLSANLFGWDPAALHLHNFGLGERDATAVLTVPRHNQGGAFISGDANAYGDAILQDRKRTEDGLDQVTVAIRRGRDVFRDLFAAMPAGGFAVKIDTEGYEQTIIREIAAAMPDGARIGIVFENLESTFDGSRFLREDLGATGLALKLTDNTAGIRSHLAKEFIKLTRGKVFRLTDRPIDWLGSVVLMVEKPARQEPLNQL